MRPFLFFLAAIAACAAGAGSAAMRSPDSPVRLKAASHPSPPPSPTFPPVFEVPPILMYHRIDVERPADPIGRELTVTPAAFASQLRCLHDLGLKGIDIANLVRRLRAGQSLRGDVVLTFDDGYNDQYTYAYPLLQRAKVAATFYVVTRNVGLPRHLSWNELRTMARHGFDIGCHGLSHDDLRTMADWQQAAQIFGCLHEVRQRLGIIAESYAYPSGGFDSQTLALVRKAGVALALTTDPGNVLPPQNRYQLTRLRVLGSWSSADFEREVVRAQARRVLVLR